MTKYAIDDPAGMPESIRCDIRAKAESWECRTHSVPAELRSHDSKRTRRMDVYCPTGQPGMYVGGVGDRV